MSSSCERLAKSVRGPVCVGALASDDIALKYGVETLRPGPRSRCPLGKLTADCAGSLVDDVLRGGEKSARSLEQTGQRAVPIRLHVSQCPQTMPISCSSVPKLPSVSQCEAPF